MILKIEQSKYYGYNNKTKILFVQVYKRKPKLTWTENVNLDGNLCDGWFSDDKKEYLLKLPEEGEFKRFTGNSVRMFEFLKNHGAIEVEGDEKGVHIDYDDQKGFLTQVDRYGRFVGADLMNHYRVEEILVGMPENWGIKWSNKIGVSKIPTRDEIAKDNVKKVLEIMQPKNKVIRKIIRRIKI